MIIALPILVFIQDAIFSAIGRLVRPYYNSFSLTFKSQNEEDEDDEQVFAEYDEEKGVVFFPPMYAQRYAAFSDCLMDERWAGQLEKIVDFGYNDMSFIRYIKEMPGVKKIVGVDLDSIPLCCSSDLLGVSEYGPKRETPVQVMLFQGNAADPDYRLIGTDAVVAIELIEHMLPHDLDRFVHTIFGFIKPRIAVISTPNGDFNVLFKSLESNGFRRLDHFFEWSREQFHDWCSNIVERYPGYTVTCQGIGPGPDGTAHLGCCSQMALFVAKSYQKQIEFTVNSLALVAQTAQNYFYVNSESGDTDISSQQPSTEMQILNYGTDILQRQTLTIYMTGPAYASYEDSLENCDKTSQCNLDSELGKNYLMDGEEVASSETSVIVPRRRDRYNVYEIGDIACRLNCTTLQAKKFSKTTQNLMTKNRIDSIIHTKEIVDEIKSLAKMLNFDRTSVAKNNSNIWNNINWGDNAPYWNEYYKLVKEFSYPFEVISEDSRILDVITDEINRLIDEQFDEDYVGFTNNHHNKLEIPIEYLVRKVRHITSDVGKVREVLEWNGYEIVDNVVLYTRVISEETSLEDATYDQESQSNDKLDEDLLSKNSGVSIRRAIDKKIQKLRSTLTADEDISFEMDRVVCQLVRLALRTNRHRDTPIPTRWLLLKIYDLLNLNIKAIEKKNVNFSCHYQGSLAITDDIEDNKSDVTHNVDKSYVIETEDANSYITQIVENIANNVQQCGNSEEQSDESISIPDAQLLDDISEETSKSQNFEDGQDAIPTLRKPRPDYVQEPPIQLQINQIDSNELSQCQRDTEPFEYSAEFINLREDMLRSEIDNGLIENLAKMTIYDLDSDQVQVLKKLMEYSYGQCTKDIFHVKSSDIRMLDQPGPDPNFSYQTLRLNETELNSPADEPYRTELSKLHLKQLDQYEIELYRLEQSFITNKLYVPHLNEIKDTTYNPQLHINNLISNVGNTNVYDDVNEFLYHGNFFETLKKYQEDNTAIEIMKKYKDILNSEAETEEECDKDTKESAVFDGDNFSYLSSIVFSNGNYIAKHPELGGLNLSGETKSYLYLNQCDDSGNDNFSQINKRLSSSSTDTLDEHSQCESVSSEHTSKNDAFECECDSWIEQNIDNSGSTFCRSTGIHSITTVDILQNVTKKRDKIHRKMSKSNQSSKSGQKTDLNNCKKTQNKILNSNKFVANGTNIITENINIEHNQVPLDIKVKQDDNTARQLQSKSTKPIPGEMTMYCQSNTETVQKIIEVSDIFSKDKCSNVQKSSNVAVTEESMLVEIITEDLCETISFRRTMGTSFDNIDIISEQEVIHDKVLLDSNLNTDCLHSAEKFQTQTISYDLDQPSTSKCYKRVTNEVQCGPDIVKRYSYNPSKKDTETSTHNCDFCAFSTQSKHDNITSTCQVGIKDSDDNLQGQTSNPRETDENVQTELQLDASKGKTNITYLRKPKIECKNESPLKKNLSTQLIDLKAPECENLMINDLGNDLICSIESLPIQMPEYLNKSTNLDTDLVANNENQFKLQRGGVYIHSYKDKNVLEDVVFQGEWQRYRTSSLSPERPCSNISSKYLSENSMNKLRSSSTPIYLRNKCKDERGQPKKVFSSTKALKVQLIKTISKVKLMKLPSDVLAKLNCLSSETRYLSDTTMKRANDFKLKENIKIQSIKTALNAQTRRLVSLSKKPLANTKTLNDKNHETVKAKRTLLCKKCDVQRQGNENYKIKFNIEKSTKKTVASRTTKRKSATKLSFVTNKASKDRVVKKAKSKTAAVAQKNLYQQKNKHHAPNFKNKTEETRPKADSYSIFTNMLFPPGNDSDYKNLNPLQKLFEHNLNYLLYRQEMNITNSTEKSPSPTSLKRASNHSADRSLSPTLIGPALKKSSSPIFFIQHLEKNDDNTLGSPDCSSVNSVCTVKELSPRSSKSPDRIMTLPKRKLEDSPRANNKISKIPRLIRPIHKKVVDAHATANTSNPMSKPTKNSPVSNKLGIPRLTKHTMKTSTPLSTPAKSIIIAQVITTDTSNTGFKLHTKAAVKINHENDDSKLKMFNKVSSEAASTSTPKANTITDTTQKDDKLSENNITSEKNEIKICAQELSSNINSTNAMGYKINNETEDVDDTIDLSSMLNSESIKITNEECGSKVPVQDIFMPCTAVLAGTESIADTMVTVTDTDMMSFRSISSDKEFTEAHDGVDTSTEVKDIFDRRKQLNSQSPSQTGTLAGPIIGYSVDGSNVGDCHDPINMIDSETGSLADATARVVTSEEVFVSGQSSESYQLSQDAVVPNWLFNLIDQQNRASGGEHQMDDDEVPFPIPTPPNLTNNVVAIDLNGNVVVEGLVGASAGAGDGRGIYSRDSSGRGSSLSSSDDEDTSRPDSEETSEQSTYQSTSADIPGTSSELTLHLGTSNISSALDDDHQLQTESNSAFNQSLPYSSSGCDADVSSNDTDVQN